MSLVFILVMSYKRIHSSERGWFATYNRSEFDVTENSTRAYLKRDKEEIVVSDEQNQDDLQKPFD